MTLPGLAEQVGKEGWSENGKVRVACLAGISWQVLI